MDRGPQLLCTGGLLAGKQFSITPEGLRIGREPGNEVHLDDTGVSRQHARVLLHNGAVWVQDAGSRNGIFVNGERVPDHKQLKFGDKLAVGNHMFEVVAPATTTTAAPAPPPQPARTPPEDPAPKWKIWPFLVAFLLVACFVTCIGVFGAVRGDPAVGSAPATPAYSLTTVLEPGAAPPAVAPPAVTPTASQALALVAGVGDNVAGVPDPPAGTTSRQLLDSAQASYDGGRLADARLSDQMALKLDPTCEICRLRIDRIQTELAASVQQSFDAGMRAYNAMQFQQAIVAWETVLMLAPDPKDPIHVQTTEYLQKAKEGAAAR
jgi:hypothetical protein